MLLVIANDLHVYCQKMPSTKQATEELNQNTDWDITSLDEEDTGHRKELERKIETLAKEYLYEDSIEIKQPKLTSMKRQTSNGDTPFRLPFRCLVDII